MDAREEALERLYRDRYSRFRDGLATITGSYDTAHDVVQDAFAQALVKRGGFREQGSLEGWVWRIAFRLALRERRRGLRQAPRKAPIRLSSVRNGIRSSRQPYSGSRPGSA